MCPFHLLYISVFNNSFVNIVKTRSFKTFQDMLTLESFKQVFHLSELNSFGYFLKVVSYLCTIFFVQECFSGTKRQHPKIIGAICVFRRQTMIISLFIYCLLYLMYIKWLSMCIKY